MSFVNSHTLVQARFLFLPYLAALLASSNAVSSCGVSIKVENKSNHMIWSCTYQSIFFQMLAHNVQQMHSLRAEAQRAELNRPQINAPIYKSYVALSH